MFLTPAELAACSVFISYFAIIGALFALISRDLARRVQKPVSDRLYMFGGLTVCSFAHTWFYMFKFMAWSFRDFEASNIVHPDTPIIVRISRWLLNTSLFEQAWARVCFGKVNWWWSQQLCLYTVGGWTVFLAIEGQRHHIKRVWAYMLLGQLVAISVASNLFYLALALSPSHPRQHGPRQRAPLTLWLPVVLSLITVAASPFTDTKTFLPNLLVMHALTMIPLLFPTHKSSSGVVTIQALYSQIAFVSIFLSAFAGFSAFSDSASFSQVMQSIWATLHEHPAQSSIGWDVVWTSLSLLVWYRSFLDNLVTKILAASALPILSLGATAPLLGLYPPTPTIKLD
ncbi:hypothetical protein MIND_00598400 [Mycena indigotica]|uniref:Uncharacterized protein n=1 Tax=Mycena indigotica TaxID=2126181 RepID=A0A8H6SRG3_9AGAR|nr:uncharacterized protein MIND_00598400 [Mycena indigotica]KAF7303690.1 hypothetical protein MIND_00598400 [Mycena indigotica]